MGGRSPMANACTLETDLQPPFHVGVSHAMMAFGGAYADKSDTVIDTGSRESMPDKENGMRLAGFELPESGEGQRQLEFDVAVERY